ncbi:MAG: peptidoglycan binding domain-containing protein [Eggerthellaceae bacterium]|nr:peptidoglycan binding domain-containing protein [Eggerthellaceae bacterium]
MDLTGLEVSNISPDGEVPTGFVPEFDVPKNKSRKIGKIIGITLGSIVGMLAIVYVAGALVFSNWFLPNTTIGDMDISLKTSDEVADMIDDVAANYTLDVVGDGFSYRADADDLGLEVNSASIVRTMHEDLNSWMWPYLILQPNHDEAGRFEVTFKQALYQDGVKAAVETFNETATPPTNATITYDESSESFKVKPEEIGTQLDTNAVLGAMARAIGSLNPKVALGPDELLQPKIFSTDEKLVQSAELATGMIKAKLTLNLAGQEVGTVSADELAQFVVMNEENYEVTLDDAALDEWVTALADGYNTVGSERTYTREDGKVITVSGGVYGWEVDTEALRDAIIEGVKSGSSTTIDIPCSQEAAVYNGPGERDWGGRYIDVDLAEQYVRFYDWDGSVIWEAPCISGKPDGVHDTNTGVYVINAKRSPEKLEGYENGVKIYTSYVTYWMPFVGNAIGLHDADWQPSFGGSMYANGYGSHGCVNLPPYSAAELYGIVDVGDVVVSHW